MVLLEGNIDESGSTLGAVRLGVCPVNGLVGNGHPRNDPHKVIIQKLDDRSLAVVIFVMLAEAPRIQTRAGLANDTFGIIRSQTIGSQVNSARKHRGQDGGALIEFDEFGCFIVEIGEALHAFRAKVMQVIVVGQSEGQVTKLDRSAAGHDMGSVRRGNRGRRSVAGFARDTIGETRGYRVRTCSRFWWRK